MTNTAFKEASIKLQYAALYNFVAMYMAMPNHETKIAGFLDDAIAQWEEIGGDLPVPEHWIKIRFGGDE